MRRKKRVWSDAVICEAPQTTLPVKRRMPARRASAGRASGPRLPKTCEASSLEDQRIIGESRARSAAASSRRRTAGCRT